MITLRQLLERLGVHYAKYLAARVSAPGVSRRGSHVARLPASSGRGRDPLRSSGRRNGVAERTPGTRERRRNPLRSTHGTIGLVNDGTEPLGITFTFSRPGFEALMRDNSVLEGQPVSPISAEERARIQGKPRWHTIAGPPPQQAWAKPRSSHPPSNER